MFTNWLTGTSGVAASQTLSNPNSTTTLLSNGLPSSSLAHTLPQLSAGIMANPPDVILEVGPAPSVRFVAHSLVLGMHSGYLRSAIRLDEQPPHAAAATEMILYLGNVTAEQFGPLLSYMYTGYLDLNVENIFAVLLATHVLHMPRALEICRSFLARAQTEGYLGSSLALPPPLPHTNAKIIRPIASKATIPNMGFISSATQSYSNSVLPVERASSVKPSDQLERETDPVNDEDEEVFIDSSSDYSDAEIVERPIIRRFNYKAAVQAEKLKETVADDGDDVVVITTMRSERSSKNKESKSKKHKNRKSTGLQVAKAPIPASQLDLTDTVGTPSSSKFIVDVASCDGPVRFRRILNTAYGHKPEATSSNQIQPERTQQSLSLSFHQQMAKAISQQRQLNHQHADESENSESSGGAATSAPKSSGSSKCVNASNEIFVCVYCKHTFKSQYCYQKHAKRHLNPLSLNGAEKPACRAAFSLPAAAAVSKSANELLKREVRPLDMNVQYYPCKTCGSKFPSYYFVHKHRKMCHAEEEAAGEAGTANNAGSDSSQSGGETTATCNVDAEVNKEKAESEVE